MADYIVKDTELTSIANAIRTAGGTNSLLSFPNGFVSAVNNISGGGGSSDFSTATVVYSSTYMDGIYLAYIDEGFNTISPIMDAEGTYQVPLYNGTAMGLCPEGIVSVMGNIQNNNNVLTITGDCTITIS